MAISFSYADRQLSLSGKLKIRAFVSRIFDREGISLDDVSYVFCSDEYLLDINLRFLNHDYYTDIITFDLRDNSSQPVTGEIYISVDRVRDNATTLGTSFSAECLRVIFHGALHLCGYRDKTKREIGIMRNKEDEYLRLYFTIIRST